MIYINQEKLNKIKLNKDNMYVVLDFDKTITSTDSTDSWDATGKKLSKEFYNKINDLYFKYRPIETNYKILFEEKNRAMKIWYNECMNLYYDHNLTKSKLLEGIETSNLKFRQGAKEFLKEMYEKEIPVIILSAGIGNTIKKFLDKNDCLYKNILIISNFIEFDETGNMKEFQGEVIHSLNKNLKKGLLNDFYKEIENKNNALLIGDAIEDKMMLPKEKLKDSITVGFLTENVKENFEEYTKNFDIVLTNTDDNFTIIKKILVGQEGQS